MITQVLAERIGIWQVTFVLTSLILRVVYPFLLHEHAVLIINLCFNESHNNSIFRILLLLKGQHSYHTERHLKVFIATFMSGLWDLAEVECFCHQMGIVVPPSFFILLILPSSPLFLFFLSLYLYRQIYTHIYTHSIYIHIYTKYAYIYACIHIVTYTYIHIHIYKNIHMCIIDTFAHLSISTFWF